MRSYNTEGSFYTQCKAVGIKKKTLVLKTTATITITSYTSYVQN